VTAAVQTTTQEDDPYSRMGIFLVAGGEPEASTMLWHARVSTPALLQGCAGMLLAIAALQRCAGMLLAEDTVSVSRTLCKKQLICLMTRNDMHWFTPFGFLVLCDVGLAAGLSAWPGCCLYVATRRCAARPCRPCWCCEPHCHSTSGSPQDATAGAGRAQDVDTRRHAFDVSRRWVAVQQFLPGTQLHVAACLRPMKAGRALVPPQAAALSHWGCQQTYYSSGTERCAPCAVDCCRELMPHTSLPQWRGAKGGS
jgi:hypothetical protein